LTSWRVGDVALAGQPVGSNALAPGIDGLFGGATLRHYSPVVVDYTDGELLLGPQTTN
jgi:hypothetical protein